MPKEQQEEEENGGQMDKGRRVQGSADAQQKAGNRTVEYSELKQQQVQQSRRNMRSWPNN